MIRCLMNSGMADSHHTILSFGSNLSFSKNFRLKNEHFKLGMVANAYNSSTQEDPNL